MQLLLLYHRSCCYRPEYVLQSRPLGPIHYLKPQPQATLVVRKIVRSNSLRWAREADASPLAAVGLFRPVQLVAETARSDPLALSRIWVGPPNRPPVHEGVRMRAGTRKEL